MRHPPPRSRRPRISVVVPSYQQGAFLEEALRSILEQDFPAAEILVADGGSTDGSVDILRRYDDRLAWWTSGPDGGQAAAINAGLRRATGDVVGWLNSDDRLAPGALRRIAAAFRKPGVDVVCGLRRRIDAEGRLVGRWVRDLPTRWYLRHYCCVAQETVYWRRRVLERVGWLDEGLHYALDYDYWLRILDAGFRFTLLPAYLGDYREHPASKTATLQEVYRRDMAELRRRHGLGRSEEEIQAGLGEHWPWHLGLLEDLGDTPFAASPRAVGLLLRLLERPGADRAVSRLYRLYRERRPRGRVERSRLGAFAGALGELLRGGPGPQPVSARPRIARPLLPWATARGESFAGERPDALVLGAGWSWCEQSVDDVYRWADDDAEVLVLRPSGSRRRLLLELQTGPSLGWSPFVATVLDEEERDVGRLAIRDRETVAVDLPLASGPSVRCFRLRVGGHGRPASAADSRVLRFRITHLAWAEEDGAREARSPPGALGRPPPGGPGFLRPDLRRAPGSVGEPSREVPGADAQAGLSASFGRADTSR